MRRPLIAAAAGLALADASIVTLALPPLLDELDTTVEGVAAVIAIYTFGLAAGVFPAEALRRRAGPARLAVGSLALFAAASLGCAGSGSLEVLLGLRAAQALGGAGVLVSAFAMLAAGGRGGGRLWVIAATIGIAVGPALGGALTQLLDWRAIFLAQVPLVLAALWLCLPAARRRADPPAAAVPESAGAPAAEVDRGPAVVAPGAAVAVRGYLALAALSGALTAVLFLLVVLLISGWGFTPLAAAGIVTVLPVAAVAGSRIPGEPRARAVTGCLLVAAGVASLAFLPEPSGWWTGGPQLLAGLGMGLSLPAVAGRLLPERTPRDAARLLAVRHLGITLALVALAPLVSAELDSAIDTARERGTAAVLDARLPPLDKIRLAPVLLGDVDTEDPRGQLSDSLAEGRDAVSEGDRAEYDRLGQRADATLVAAVRSAFRLAFLIAGALGVVAAGLLWRPSVPGGARPWVALAALAAFAVPLAHWQLEERVAPEPVRIADPCAPRELPGSGGITGAIQDRALVELDRVACEFGSSREELVLALADEDAAEEYEQRHGVNPRSADLAGGILRAILGF